MIAVPCSLSVAQWVLPSRFVSARKSEWSAVPPTEAAMTIARNFTVRFLNAVSRSLAVSPSRQLSLEYDRGCVKPFSAPVED
jgi:hypothetical protein